MRDTDALIWWWCLCGVTAFNLVAWGLSARALSRRRAGGEAAAWRLARAQLLLSAIYVLGCGYRSAFPVFDVPRLAMVDSWLSSVIVGRSVATLAELAFAAQWALLLRGIGQVTSSPLAVRVSRCIVPLIVVAEMCSWYAVLTTSNLGHVIEESLWALCAALLVASFVFVWPRCRPAARPAIALASVVGLGYFAYMVGVDVPMYWARWIADLEQGRPYLSLEQGLTDASSRWVVSHSWQDWHSEVIWMSVYFSVGVWFSIALMHVRMSPLAPGIMGTPVPLSRCGGSSAARCEPAVTAPAAAPTARPCCPRGR